NGWYSDMAPGQCASSGRTAAETDKGVPSASAPANIAAGGRYSYYMSGSYDPDAKSADSFIAEDPIPAIDHSVAYVRFGNAISNEEPMTLNSLNRLSRNLTALGYTEPYKS